MLDYIYFILKTEIPVTGKICYFAKFIKSIFFFCKHQRNVSFFFPYFLHFLMLYCSDNFTFDKMSGIISLIERALELVSLPHGLCSAFSKHGH